MYTINYGVQLHLDFDKENQGGMQEEATREQHTVINSQTTVWRPPQAHFIKVNTDAAWRKDFNDGVTGVVGRDAGGEFIGASFKRLQWVSSPLTAEAQALREGLHFAWRHNCKQVELESDSRQMIQILKGKVKTPFEVEMIVGTLLTEQDGQME
ncbi:hypothetical protein Leryth_005515, partial [Lithospermum erythrorhizon]